MTIIQQKIRIDRPVGAVYAFLTDLRHHEQLMPENVQNWSSTADEAHFGIQHMIELTLRVDLRRENECIKLIPVGKTPFDLTMQWTMLSVSDIETDVTFIIEADLNMMMKMVATGPLQKLVDFQVSKLKNILI